MAIINAISGNFIINPCISSISLLPMTCSVAPTDKNISDFDTEWNIIKRIADQIDSYVPIPAQAVISPKFAIVEYANTFLASFCEIAIIDISTNVIPPIKETKSPAIFPANIGEILINKYTPALTIVDEWSNAELGVGATIAPNIHFENGNCADFEKQAIAINIAGIVKALLFSPANDIIPLRSQILKFTLKYIIAIAKQTPPIKFIYSAVNALLTDSLVSVYLISRKELKVVISQKKYIQVKSFDKTIPNIADRKINIIEKNTFFLSLTSLWMLWKSFIYDIAYTQIEPPIIAIIKTIIIDNLSINKWCSKSKLVFAHSFLPISLIPKK